MAFIMRNRLTHANLKTNPYASYLFKEDGPGYQGVRLLLRKVKEDADKELIRRMTRRHLSPEEDAARGPKFIVYFEIQQVLPLVGDGAPHVTVS